jgi:hypothetical protein
VGDDVGSPGKVYEYIGARKPILALAPDGFIKSTVLEAGGTAIAPTDVAGIKAALEEFFIRFDRRQLKGPKAEIVDKYNRVSLTGALVKIFNSLFEP